MNMQLVWAVCCKPYGTRQPRLGNISVFRASGVYRCAHFAFLMVSHWMPRHVKSLMRTHQALYVSRHPMGYHEKGEMRASVYAARPEYGYVAQARLARSVWLATNRPDELHIHQSASAPQC